MNTLDLNTMFGRTHIAEEIKRILALFDQECTNIDYKKGIYIYGSPGAGKTYFVQALLKSIGYDVVKYDAGDVRNKALIDTITSDNVSQFNVLDMMYGRTRKIAIVMDEIDGMHKGDKGGISALVKLIRQKKTKKQKSEHVTLNPIICIGNYYTDKKIKELIKVCHVFELPAPTEDQVRRVLTALLPDRLEGALLQRMVQYAQGDIRKIEFLYKLFCQHPEMLSPENIDSILHTKYYNEDYGKITKLLFDTPVPIERQADFMNDNDRTTVALLWHENIPDRLVGMSQREALPFYLKLIDNICYADYIDRITFQNQIWLFNELSTFIKTFHNNFLFHRHFASRPSPEEALASVRAVKDVRFTKVLTKYSTEYSNQIFLYMMSQELDMDKKDLASFFQELRFFYGADYLNKAEGIADAEQLFAATGISRLDIKRMFRYMDKNTKRESAAKNRATDVDLGDDDDEDDEDDPGI